MKGPSAPPSRHGYIIVCDIVAFSEKPEKEQVRAVQYLDASLNQALALNSLRRHIYTNCTGDGFIAVLPTDAVDSPEEACLELCRVMLDTCTKYEPLAETDAEYAALRLRFGIHKGDYRANVSAFGGKHMIGRGPNDATRVANVGDAGDVLVSERFFQEGQGEAWSRRFSAPFDAHAKHNRLQTVRVYIGNGNGSSDARPLPRRLELATRLDEQIRQDVRFIHDALVDTLPKRRRGKQYRPGCRVTVYVRGAEHVLHPSYRFHWRDGHASPGVGTKYSFDPPVGAVGYAYHHGERQVCLGLPDPKEEPDAYYRWWLRKRRFSHTLESLREWKRHPRALIATPFGISPDRHSRAVLCVDFSDPLTGVTPGAIDAVFEGVEEFLDQDLAWKLLARRLV